MNEKACSLCRFWVRIGEVNIGDCRKNPPMMVREGNPFNLRVWPNTYDIDWCDAFKRVKEKKKDKDEEDAGDKDED